MSNSDNIYINPIIKTFTNDQFRADVEMAAVWDYDNQVYDCYVRIFGKFPDEFETQSIEINYNAQIINRVYPNKYKPQYLYDPNLIAQILFRRDYTKNDKSTISWCIKPKDLEQHSDLFNDYKEKNKRAIIHTGLEAFKKFYPNFLLPTF